MLPQLAEDPRVAYARTADHQACAVGFIQHPLSFCYRGDVAIGKHWAGKAFGCAFNIFVVHLAAVRFFDGAGVEAKEIHIVFLDQIEDGVEMFVAVEADAHLYGEPSLDRCA